MRYARAVLVTPLAVLVPVVTGFLRPAPTSQAAIRQQSSHRLRAAPQFAVGRGGESFSSDAGWGDMSPSAPDTVNMDDLRSRMEQARGRGAHQEAIAQTARSEAASILQQHADRGSERGGSTSGAVRAHELWGAVGEGNELDAEAAAAMEAFMQQQKELRRRLKVASVLIFNPGQATEGIYTLWVQGQNIVLGFESRQEAVRYALMLKAQEFHSPSPQQLELSELKNFCKEAGVGLQLVPAGSGLTPPEANKPELEYDPLQHASSRRRQHAHHKEPLLSKKEADALRQRFNDLLSATDEA